MRKTMLIVTAALLALTGTISAQDWPSSRVITLIIPFAPGGGVDASGRIQAQRMGELLGQTIIVENVGAGAGTVGSQRVAKATPDGYTMLMGMPTARVCARTRPTIPSPISPRSGW
jgi:tripartite-type tricarboxylate transporter receptor subunit TctC